MRRSNLRLFGAVMLPSLSLVALTACSQSVALEATEDAPPPGGTQIDDDGVVQDGPVAWWLSDDSFAVAITSGSCVPTPTAVSSDEESDVRVTFERPFALGCSASSVWYTYELALPDGVSPSTTTSVVIEGLTDEPTTIDFLEVADP